MNFHNNVRNRALTTSQQQLEQQYVQFPTQRQATNHVEVRKTYQTSDFAVKTSSRIDSGASHLTGSFTSPFSFL